MVIFSFYWSFGGKFPKQLLTMQWVLLGLPLNIVHLLNITNYHPTRVNIPKNRSRCQPKRQRSPVSMAKTCKNPAPAPCLQIPHSLDNIHHNHPGSKARTLPCTGSKEHPAQHPWEHPSSTLVPKRTSNSYSWCKKNDCPVQQQQQQQQPNAFNTGPSVTLIPTCDNTGHQNSWKTWFCFGFCVFIVGWISLRTDSHFTTWVPNAPQNQPANGVQVRSPRAQIEPSVSGTYTGAKAR